MCDPKSTGRVKGIAWGRGRLTRERNIWYQARHINF